MNALLDHVWGESPAVDRVWEHVAGLAPRKAVSRPLMALQAFIDDSYTKDGVLVLAGCMATAETWAKFSRDWEQALPWGLRDERGYYFHMAEMALIPERMARVGAFYRIIEEHELLLVCSKINISDLRRAIDRVWVLGHRLNHGLFAQPHVMAFVALVESVLKQRSNCAPHLGEAERVDFILDEHSQDKFMLKFWNDFTSTKPDDVNIDIGKLPRFESDRDFLPLQAADLLAWWFRRWHEEGRITQDKFEPSFDGVKIQKPMNVLLIEKTEDNIVETLRGYILSSAKKDIVVYDSKYARPFP